MLEIIKIPTPSLRERSVEIDRDFLLSTKIQKLIEDMIPTMYDDDGVGLAAPQVAQNYRICVLGKVATPDGEEDLVLVNPVWEKTGRRKNWDTEGCLSVPNVFGKVKRYNSIHVSAWNKKGEEINFEAKGFFARVIQHEVDHLDGILFIDKAKGIYNVEKEKKIREL